MMSDDTLGQYIDCMVYALLHPEDPHAFSRAYCTRQALVDHDSAKWFYRNHTSFETKYSHDCAHEDDDVAEPAWVSDHGLGVKRLLDDADDTFDEERRMIQAALKLVYRKAPHCLPTLRLVLVYGTDRRMSITALLGFKPITKLNLELARQKYTHDVDVLIVIFETRNRRNAGQQK